tara:strand:- start:190 stop:507 length:318 start_codon:yes stop_codon:yes gene_type:complete
MNLLKGYDNGGVLDFELPKSRKDLRLDRRALRKEEREDERDMIPVRFRNRGQEGLDAYRDMMRKRGGKSRGEDILEWLRALLQQQRGNTQKSEGHCEGGSCGQFG